MSLRPVWAVIVVRPSLRHKNKAESWAQGVGLPNAHASDALALGSCARMFSVDRFCSLCLFQIHLLLTFRTSMSEYNQSGTDTVTPWV